jgi:hypothetical protein
MTLAASNYLEGKWFDHLLRATAFTAPSAIYAQLHTGDPGEDGTSNVLSTSGAARVAVSFSAASARVAASSTQCEFGPFAGDPPAVTHVTLWDALTSGNCLAQGADGASVDGSTNGILRIAAGALTLALKEFQTSPLADISTAAANALLNLTLRGTAYSAPTGHKVALYSNSPGVGDTGTELTGNGYAQQAITFGAATDGVGSNSNAQTFGPATGSNWTACTHVAIKDGSGNLLIFGDVTDFTLLVGQSWLFSIGDLVAKVG